MSDFEVLIENTWTYLKPKKSIDYNLMKIIETEMSYFREEFSSFRRETIELEMPLFERERLRYPTGLYSVLERIFIDNKISFEVLDCRNAPILGSSIDMQTKRLRDYQQETLENAIKSERGVIKVATGGGKTVIAAAIVAKLNLKTLFIVYSVDLLKQTADEFSKMFGLEVGRIGGGECVIRQINICTIQTLYCAFDLKYEAIDDENLFKEKINKSVFTRKEEIRKVVKDAEVVVCDECHRCTSNIYIQMMKLFENAYYRFSLSATPYKNKSIDKVLDAYSGKQICNISASYLIQRGFLVRPTIYMLDPNESYEYKFVEKSFKNVYDQYIVNNKTRNQMVVESTERLLELGKSVLVTVTRLSHGDILSEMLDKAGVKSIAFIKGDVDGDTRKDLINKVRNKKLDVIVGSVVCDEGIDIPALGAAVMAGGGKSLQRSLQRVGRTLRPYPSAENNEKKEAIIVDFYDRIRYLSGHSKKRLEIYGLEPEFKILKSFSHH